MALRYLKAAGGNFNGGSTWSATGSGGVDTVAAPTASDDVILEAGSGQLTISAAAACRSFDCTSGTGLYTGTITHNAFTLSIGTSTAGAGNVALKLSGGLTYTLANANTSAIAFVSSSATQQTITTATKTLGNISVNGTNSSYLLTDNLTQSGNFTYTTGTTFDTTTNSVVWTQNGVTSGFNGSNKTYYELDQTGSGQSSLSTSMTFTNLKRIGTSAKADGIAISANQTVTGIFTATGNNTGARCLVQATNLGSPVTITAAAVSLTNAIFQDITGAGTATWSGTYIGNGLGNTNISFASPRTLYRVTSGGNWSDTNWATSTGGSAGQNPPLPQDDVFIDANSNTGVLTFDLNNLCQNLDCTNAPAKTLSQGNGGLQPTIYGNLTLGGSIATSGGGTVQMSARSSKTITCGGKTIAWPFQINGPGGTFTLQDTFTLGSTRALTLLLGTFVDNGQTVSIGGLTSQTSGTRAITKTGNWSLQLTTATTVWLIANTTGLTISDTAGAIIIASTSTNTRTFTGGSKAYNNLQYTVAGSTGQLTISDANSFNDISFSDVTNARTLQLTSATTTTIRATHGLTGVVGTSGKLMTISAVTAASAATLDFPNGYGGSSDYLSVKDITATTNTWYAGNNSTNVSGNTNVTFSGVPTPGSKTQSAIARIQISSSLTQGAVSRLSKSFTTTQPGVARIQTSGTLTQSATARLSKSFTLTQGGIARISKAFSLTQGAISRVQKGFTKTQGATANIIVGGLARTKTQSAIASLRQIASKGSYTTLPTTKADLITQFTAAEVVAASAVDSVWASQSSTLAGSKNVQMFTIQGTDITQSINVAWTGKSTNTGTVTIEIYNLNSNTWETLTTGAGTTSNSTLTGVKTTNLTNYYDANKVVYIRVYQ